MRILLDNCTPKPLRRRLPGHQVEHCSQRGWAVMGNGELLRAAEIEFDLFITCDQNIRYQQNLTGRKIAILELRIQSWSELKPLADEVAAAIASMKLGEYRTLF